MSSRRPLGLVIYLTSEIGAAVANGESPAAPDGAKVKSVRAQNQGDCLWFRLAIELKNGR